MLHSLEFSGGMTDLDCDTHDLEVYKVHRYKLGVGEGPLEHIPDKALPLECNLLQLNGGITTHLTVH